MTSSSRFKTGLRAALCVGIGLGLLANLVFLYSLADGSVGAGQSLARALSVARGDGGGRTPTLLLIVQPADCRTAIGAIRRLQDRLVHTRVNFRGLLTADASAKVTPATLRAELGLQFPFEEITARNAWHVLHKLGYSRSGVLILLDVRGAVAAAAYVDSPAGHSLIEAVAAALSGDSAS